MWREFDGRQLALAAGFGLCSLLFAAVGLVWVLQSDDGGFDAIDPIDTDNTPPVFDGGPGESIDSAVGEVVAPVTVQANDADGDDLTFTAIGLPGGISIDASTGTISGRATAPCICEATIIAEDGRGGRDTLAVLWTVTGDADAGPVDSLAPLLEVEELATGETLPDTNDRTTTTAASTATTASASPSTTIASTTATSNDPGGSDTSSGASTPTTTGTTTTIAATTVTTTATPTTSQPDNGGSAFQGVRGFDSFFQGRKQYDGWTGGDIAFYAPQGQVPPAVAANWIDWYVRVDAMYRTVSGRSDFDSVYRRGTPDLGSRKVLAIVETCGAGCGSKQQAEADPGYIDAMVNNPGDFSQHWIFFYEMGRGGSPEPWYGRATWPSNTVIIPHLMAGLAFYELGGESGLRQGIPGDILGELERWEAADIEYVDEFATADQQSSGNYTSHHLMPAMLWRIRMETDLATVGRVTANMATKPQSTSAVQAMCDFRAAVNDATGGRFDARMTGPWGLPDQC